MDATRYRMARFERGVPGERLQKESPLATQLFKRDRELRAPRKALGEKFELKVAKVRKAKKIADAGPNAPLLKRIILSPYVQDVARVKKAAYRENTRKKGEFRSKTPPAMRTVRAEFPRGFAGNPLKTFPTQVEARPRPSAEAWLALRGER